MMSKQELDQEIANVVRTGLAKTRAEIMKVINTKLAKSGSDETVSDRDADNSLKRLSAAKVLTFSKLEKEWQEVTASAGSATGTSPGVSSDNKVTAPAASTTEETKMDNTNISSIDAAINAAKKNKKTDGDKPERAKLTPEEREARNAQQKAERETKKLEREAKREAKRAEQAANKRAPHLSKVEKAAEKLPVLSDKSQQLFNEIVANYGRDQVQALSAHLVHFNRVKATERALTQKVNVGDQVRITGGESRFIGTTGEVIKSQRIRCYVQVPGHTKPVYLFTSDVEVIEVAKAETPSSTGTNG